MTRQKRKPVAVGERFGRLVVKAFTRDIKGRKRAICECDCGRNTNTATGCLTDGSSTSCGCYMRESAAKRSTTHGGKKNGVYAAEYNTYRGMMGRCYVLSNNAYPNYGGRGIKVCERWRGNYPAFLADMGAKPGPNYSLERRDVNADYSPENCRWATRAEQSRNTRQNRRIRIGETTRTLQEWSLISRVSLAVARKRLDGYGETPEDVFGFAPACFAGSHI